MNATLALSRRSLREMIRQPDALFMAFPIFFLIVNTGHAAEIFPSATTDFLRGQGYGAFHLPITLLLAASFGIAALFLVEEIEGGYFDKLRAIPIPRYAIVLGRLLPGGTQGHRHRVGDRDHRAAVRDHDRERAARLPRTRRPGGHDQPRHLPDGGDAPLILDDLDWARVLPGFGVVAVLGVLMLAITIRMINRYD